MKKVKLNSKLFCVAMSLCLLIITSCNNDDNDNDVPVINSEMVVMSNINDPQIFNYKTSDGYNCIAYGERDLNGIPINIDNINMIDENGDLYISIGYNSNGQMSQLSTSNSTININWETNTYANVKISLPDGSEQIYTDLDLTNKASNSSVKMKSSGKKREMLAKNQLYNDLSYTHSKSITKSGSTNDEVNLIANVYNQGEASSIYFEGDVFVKIQDKKDNILDKIKLKRANNGNAFCSTFPLCPNGLSNPESSMDKILQLFKQSKSDLQKEIEQLTYMLEDLKDDYSNMVIKGTKTVEAFREYAKKSLEIEKTLTNKKVEYKDRFETDVNMYAYAVLDNAVFVSENKYKAKCGDEGIYQFSIYLDDTYISNIYLEPRNPKANDGGDYRLWMEICNIYAGTSLEVHLIGTDGYTQDGYLDYDSPQGLGRAYMDIPVAYEAGIKDKISITLTKTNGQTVKRNINTVFQ